MTSKCVLRPEMVSFERVRISKCELVFVIVMSLRVLECRFFLLLFFLKVINPRANSAQPGKTRVGCGLCELSYASFYSKTS